jgi:hypothetical protein
LVTPIRLDTILVHYGCKFGTLSFIWRDFLLVHARWTMVNQHHVKNILTAGPEQHKGVQGRVCTF